MSPRKLELHPIHLGAGASAVPQPEFPCDERAMQWYMDYGARHADDGPEGRLVSAYRFRDDWQSWERHPAGAEVVICTGGSMTIIQELHGQTVRTTLSPGEYAINPPGVWHTADIHGEAEAIFITPGVGTEHRSR